MTTDPAQQRPRTRAGKVASALARLSCCAALSVALLAPATSHSAASADASAPSRTWLALGDSYSSGEGQAKTTEARGYDYQDCARATGKTGKHGDDSDSPAKAWPVLAYESVKKSGGFQPLDFVACTGNITDDWADQMDEATRKSGHASWDVITLSFGGNNVGFSDTLEGCLGKPKSLKWGEFGIAQQSVAGCDTPIGDLIARINTLASPKTPPKSAGYKVTLPHLYDDVAQHVRPGGQVIVAGYPQLVEDVDRRPAWARHIPCEGIWPQDTGLLRAADDHLNDLIKDAVEDANKRWSGSDIRFTFADLEHNVYETSPTDQAKRHSTCSGDSWLNGRTTGIKDHDLRLTRSFHPTAVGHQRTADYVSHLVLDRQRDGKQEPRNDADNTLGWTVSTDGAGNPRLGPLRIGMDGAAAASTGVVKRNLGSYCPGNYDDTGILSSADSDVQLFFNGYNQLTDIYLSGGTPWATSQNIRLGDPMTKVKKVLGDDAHFEHDRSFPDPILVVRNKAQHTFVEYLGEEEPDDNDVSGNLTAIVLGRGDPDVIGSDRC